ncbi:uncharacterized protein CEXT_536711 [Caerostris extrusa]|uniref:Uncharacterized protein n=1 Tax=Caerostris extrusa TaxID=172846 RepID=A0AAV4Q4E4_CAEEX|nr:uncharacterized protein CEXT_536711 [Caerostris extrusa]
MNFWLSVKYQSYSYSLIGCLYFRRVDARSGGAGGTDRGGRRAAAGHQNGERRSTSGRPLPVWHVVEGRGGGGAVGDESYRQWFERQTEMQRRWEEGLMREQMELARSLLDSVTTTFLQGVQQIITSVTQGGGSHFSPDAPPERLYINKTNKSFAFYIGFVSFWM